MAANFLPFEKELIEGIIVKRKGQYIIQVLLNNEIVDCHCPTTNRIGNIDLANIACLLSESKNEKRKTKYTVEAISLTELESSSKEWIGINQNAANRYVENFILGKQMPLISDGKDLRREVILGSSKLDFEIDNTFIEVKTPLLTLDVKLGAHVKTKKVSSFDSHDRLLRHLGELSESLKIHQKAILLLCFMYNNSGFKPEMSSKRSEEVKKAVSSFVTKGVEIWQVNMEFTPYGISFTKYFPLTDQFI